MNNNSICLGTWSLGGLPSKNKSYEKLTEKNIFQILNCAIENKIKLFNIAKVYGLSENI